MIEFVIGFCVGVIVTFAVVIYIGDRQIKRKAKRATDWQKIKKNADQDISNEWGI